MLNIPLQIIGLTLHRAIDVSPLGFLASTLFFTLVLELADLD
jgi:hypothetical protein